MRPANLRLIDQQSLVKVNFYYNISSIKEIFFPLPNFYYLSMIYSALCQLWNTPLQIHLPCLEILYVHLLQLILVQTTSTPMEILEVANRCVVLCGLFCEIVMHKIWLFVAISDWFFSYEHLW
jgi:hypothetical protein